MAVTISIRGDQQLLKRLRNARRDMARRVGSALYAEAWVIMSKSKRIVPFESGVLAASGTVLLPEVRSTDVTVRLGYGGAASAYAIVQHEHEGFRHAPGRQAKYLEQPLRDALPGLEERIADRFASEVWA